MTTREQSLAVFAFGAIVLVGGGAAGYALVYDPIVQKRSASATLDAEIDELTGKLKKAKDDSRRLAEARRRSLPADEHLARREYAEMMSRLLQQANAPPGFTVSPKTSQDNKPIPLLGPKKPAYARVVTEVEFRKADMWAVQDFLTGFYRLNLLHQITAFSIKKDDDASSGGRARPNPERKDLTVKLTAEAIILDGAEDRRALLPVSNAFAALGGGSGFTALSFAPEAARGLAPIQFVPVLSTRNRDYSLLVAKDMFHGPLAAPLPLKLDRVPDLVALTEQPIPTVKILLAGDLPFLGRVTLTATTEGNLFSDGGVKVDQAAKTLSLFPVPGESGSATVTVTARAENGQEAKTSFKVAVEKKDDIAPAILLVAVTTRSDGTASALINDAATNNKYEIEAGRRRVKVTKSFIVRGTRKKDLDYDTPEELVISDPSSSTNRRFKIVSISDRGLLLIDLAPTERRPPETAAKGSRIPPPRARPTSGSAEPLAVVAGSATVAGKSQPPVLYRWAAGKSLARLTLVPEDEARKILQRAAESGPVSPIAAVSETAPTGN